MAVPIESLEVGGPEAVRVTLVQVLQNVLEARHHSRRRIGRPQRCADLVTFVRINVELPGEDHLIQALDEDVLDLLLDEVEELITGTRQRPEPDRCSPRLCSPTS